MKTCDRYMVGQRKHMVGQKSILKKLAIKIIVLCALFGWFMDSDCP